MWAGIPQKKWSINHGQQRVQNAVLGCNLKNDRMISVHFQGNPFNITVIQVYDPNSNTEEAELTDSMKTYKIFQKSHPKKTFFSL